MTFLKINYMHNQREVSLWFFYFFLLPNVVTYVNI